MAFELKRRQMIQDEITLRNQDGTIADVVKFSIDPHSAIHEYQKAQAMIEQANANLKQKGADADPTELGTAIIGLFRVLFGQDATVKLLMFYDERETELMEDIFPYITAEIVPKLRQASKEKAEQLRALK